MFKVRHSLGIYVIFCQVVILTLDIFALIDYGNICTVEND